MGAIVADFGRNEEGLNLFRINGSENEIIKAIMSFTDIGCEVYETFPIEKAHKHWSVLIKIKIPEKEEKEKENENL